MSFISTAQKFGRSIFNSLDTAKAFMGPGGRSGLHYAGAGAAAGIILGDKEQAWYTRAGRGAVAGYLFGGPLHRQFAMKGAASKASELASSADDIESLTRNTLMDFEKTGVYKRQSGRSLGQHMSDINKERSFLKSNVAVAGEYAAETRKASDALVGTTKYANAKAMALGTGLYLTGFEDDAKEGAIVGGFGFALAGAAAFAGVSGARGVFMRSAAGVGVAATAAVAPIAWSMNQSYQDSYSDEALKKQHRIKRFQESAYNLTNGLHNGRHG